MCGIFFKLSNVLDINQFQEFFKLKHRGPDASCFTMLETNGKIIYYGFHRLQIVGSSKHLQPFIQDGIFLLCNGEIYNHRKLITSFNLSPLTDSDCEVILLMYKKFGIDRVLQEIDGEFAFILYDTSKNTIFTARDPLGVRPLFINKNIDQNLTLTSESKSNELNSEQILPGNLYTITTNNTYTLTIKPYFTYSKPKVCVPFAFERLIEYSKVKDALEFAVFKRVTDTIPPLGFLLSGGLDSSLILSLSMKYIDSSKYPVQVFSIGYKSNDLVNSSEYESPDVNRAIQVVDHLKKIYGENSIEHHIVSFNKQKAIATLNKVIYMLESSDITTIRASVPMYLLCEYIRKNTKLKIILSGEGSDELFGGYIYFKCAPTSKHFFEEKIKLLKQIHLFDGLRADRMIAAHGLELRTPFLDSKLVNTVLQVPLHLSSEKYDEIEKYMLRNIFSIPTGDGNETTEQKTLPDSILWAHKEAFSDGVGHNWINQLKQEIQEQNTIKISSWNLTYNEENESNIEYVLKYMYEQDSDVFCFQNVDEKSLSRIKTFSNRYTLEYIHTTDQDYLVTIYKHEYTSKGNGLSIHTFQENIFLTSITLDFALILIFTNYSTDQLNVLITYSFDPQQGILQSQLLNKELKNIQESIRGFASYNFILCGKQKTCLDQSITSTCFHLLETINTLTSSQQTKTKPLTVIFSTVNEKEYYRLICSQSYSLQLVPFLWLPNWIDTQEPSARTLSIYSSKNHLKEEA